MKRNLTYLLLVFTLVPLAIHTLAALLTPLRSTLTLTIRLMDAYSLLAFSTDMGYYSVYEADIPLFLKPGIYRVTVNVHGISCREAPLIYMVTGDGKILNCTLPCQITIRLKMPFQLLHITLVFKPGCKTLTSKQYIRAWFKRIR